MWFFRSKNLPFHDRCALALALARRVCLVEEAKSVNALHFLKGIIHSGDPAVATIFDTLAFNYSSEINQMRPKLDDPAKQALAIRIPYANDVKKILARSHRYARKHKKTEVVATDLLEGMLEEAPKIVREALDAHGISFSRIRQQLDQYQAGSLKKITEKPPNPAPDRVKTL